jgi:hypothetical protein
MLSASMAREQPMTKLTTTALENMRRTVQSYERFARKYDTLVDAERPPHIKDALRWSSHTSAPGRRPATGLH